MLGIVVGGDCFLFLRLFCVVFGLPRILFQYFVFWFSQSWRRSLRFSWGFCLALGACGLSTIFRPRFSLVDSRPVISWTWDASECLESRLTSSESARMNTQLMLAVA